MTTTTTAIRRIGVLAAALAGLLAIGAVAARPAAAIGTLKQVWSHRYVHGVTR
ncbi:hypothetical protein Dvina_34050 [Dactylosporangium vinaceum]|uniref:Uncharacterized protein n=1 Tax=Dactylosporangium vinaceum TaxID=53362 RepID=A0ABV5MMC8_9ACTN|nr:hypothetical protein [Dactylosporangium vinaceum]UAB93273.1 hypothetical protein Dvina_34050 [Dactylosporangium vinaceum]